MSYTIAVFYIPEDMLGRYYRATEDMKRSEWVRHAIRCWTEGYLESAVLGMLPEIDPTTMRKVSVSLPTMVRESLHDIAARTGETQYSIVSRAVIYRLLAESDGSRTIPVRFTASELELIAGMGMSVPDAVHALLSKEASG